MKSFVGLPLDLLCYDKDSLAVNKFTQITQDNQYYKMIGRTWGMRLREVFSEIENPVWSSTDSTLSVESMVVTKPVFAPRPNAPDVQSQNHPQYLAQG